MKITARWAALALAALSTSALAQPSQPNILVIWGDDIGWQNVSAYGLTTMGYSTPNIDRIGLEGIRFTDHYAQPSCTAGRVAFITGQYPIRSGMTTVGQPGDTLGLQAASPSLARVLKAQGYSTGHFGKNHLGDRNEHLPTMHGFDEFFGNLYHLNAEEEPENPDYPKDPEFRKRFGPRGVLHSFADGRIEDTGPLDKKRMESIDDEVTAHALRFIEDAARQNQPFFVWWNSTHMHFRTHVKPSVRGRTGQGDYSDAMAEHDEYVGKLLQKLDELGIAHNTIVVYSTDNGPHYNTWPDAGITPFRSEKNSNWEGAFRVPAFVRWPAKLPAGKVLNGIVSHQDWLPTLLAAAGQPEVVASVRKGVKLGGKTRRVHLDGFNLLPYLSGETESSPREAFFYVDDDGQLVALRFQDWKLVFMEQRERRLKLWAEPFVPLRIPKIFHLRRDPFERADENSNTYWDWMLDHAFLLVPAQAYVAQMLQSFREFPPRQKPAAFNMDRVMDQLSEGGVSAH